MRERGARGGMSHGFSFGEKSSTLQQTRSDRKLDKENLQNLLEDSSEEEEVGGVYKEIDEDIDQPAPSPEPGRRQVISQR